MLVPLIMANEAEQSADMKQIAMTVQQEQADIMKQRDERFPGLFGSSKSISKGKSRSKNKQFTEEMESQLEIQAVENLTHETEE